MKRITGLFGTKKSLDKRWRDKLAELVVYREERKKRKKRDLKEKIKEEMMKIQKELHEKSESTRAEGRCKIFNNPDKIEYMRKRRKITLMIEHLIYYHIPRLEEAKKRS